jgi:hypothetical protein
MRARRDVVWRGGGGTEEGPAIAPEMAVQLLRVQILHVPPCPHVTQSVRVRVRWCVCGGACAVVRVRYRGVT